MAYGQDEEAYRLMYFPITIIDNFYDNFNEVKNYALGLEYFRKEKFTMPGVNTKPLNEINPHLFNKCTKKLLSVFYNRKIIRNISFECITKFEKIYPYGKNYSKEGWIHADDSNKLSAILYLNGEYEEGTSFYVNKNLGSYSLSLMNYKSDLYEGSSPDVKKYNDALIQHNSQFKEILRVPLIENRLVIFDSSIFHKSDGLGNENNPRIIQTFFFGQIYADSFPISEIKRIG
jgi:hypothetical protein